MKEIEALQDAYRMLGDIRVKLSNGSESIWKIVYHAQQHIEMMIEAELKERGLRQ